MMDKKIVEDEVIILVAPNKKGIVVEELKCGTDGSIFRALPLFDSMIQVADYKTTNQMDSTITDGVAKKARITIELLEE